MNPSLTLLAAMVIAATAHAQSPTPDLDALVSRTHRDNALAPTRPATPSADASRMATDAATAAGTRLDAFDRQQTQRVTQGMRQMPGALGEASAATAATGGGGTTDGQCRPGPICTATSDKAMPILQRLQAPAAARASSGQVSGVAGESAAAAFCVLKILAEVNRKCGDEMQSLGRPYCARLAWAQKEEFLREAKQSADAGQAMVAGRLDLDQACGWRN